MSYAIPAPTDNKLRAQLLDYAHHWLYRWQATPQEVAEALKVQLSIILSRKNKTWFGEVEAERGIREAPENQEWINEFISKAIEDAQATNEEMSR